MYELVNTSLPNGLIPGSHGFSAVAMTMGLPDTLRTRIETYCAYSHRTSAHDATYFKENPVNWFHVTLPQGDHVLGRVAPADFDYTGRTNRLARLLVFSKKEMPAIGGASVLIKERARLSEAWSGEARWLEADRLTLGRMRLEIPAVNCDAPSWRAMFGNAEGLNLAKGFARLLAKNLSMAGRTIYFKTSTAHDANGTTLLALFADLIDLLPADDRRKVTFSTYPVALPQGTICHLRGVYDRDRIFDAATATQPWVDCEKGVVHNVSLLPQDDQISLKRVSPPAEPTIKHIQQTNASTTTSTAIPRHTELLKQSQGNRNDWSIYAIISVVAAAVVSAFILFVLHLYRNVKTTDNQGLETPVPSDVGTNPFNIPNRELTNRANISEPSVNEVVTKPQTIGDSRKTMLGNLTGQNKSSRKMSDHADDEQLGRNMLSNQRILASAHDKRKGPPSKFEFVNATNVVDIWKIDGGIRKVAQTKNHLATNGTLTVFWYDKCGMLTNCFAGFVMPKTRYSQDPVFMPKPDELETNSNSFFMLWCDANEKTIYWDWSPLYMKAPTEWFINTNTIDLVDMCFEGTANEFYKTWEKLCGAPHFIIDWVTADGKSIPTDKVERSLKSEYLTQKYCEWKKKQQKNISSKNEEIIKKYIAKYDRISKAKQDYDKARQNYNRHRIALGMKHKNSKNGKKEREEFKAMKKKIEDIWDKIKADNDDQSFGGITLRYNNGRIERLNELLEALDKKIGDLKPKQQQHDKKAEEDKQRIREIVRYSKFRIKKIEGTKQ